MANYTITLKDLHKAGYNIFDDTWDTFDPEHKAELCSKIWRHYWFYEIGAETADRFKWNINEHLSLIMPYYNKLYETELMKIEPLYNFFMGIDTSIDINRNRGRGVAQRTDSKTLRDMAESIKKLAQGTSDLVGNVHMVGNETWTEDRTIDTRKVTDQDTTENTVEKVDFEEAMDETKKEVMADTVDGTKTTDGTSHTTTSGTRKYSDTPQGTVGTSGVSIESRYLTNYTAESGSSDTTTHSDEKIHNQEDRTTDTTTDRDTTSTTDTTRNVTGTNDITETTHTTDDVTGTRNRTTNTDQTQNVKTTSTEHDFSNGSENQYTSGTAYVDENETEKEGRADKRTTKGFTVSQAELIKAYRTAIINVDQMIIRELVTNFMGIF